MVYAFSYHCSKHITAPDEEKLDKNIKGLELEISDYSVEHHLDALADEGIIIDEDNEDYIALSKQNVAVEYDGSVAWELIFKADTIKYIMQRVKDINTELNPRTVDNGPGTSAHIHINRQYTRNRGIDAIDFQKACEFTAYPAFLFSGRDKDKMQEWARSTLPCPLEENLLKRAKLVDRQDDVSMNRYNIANFGPSKTYEYRLFSNSYGFDYKQIRMFMEWSDMLIDLSELMHERSYEKNLDEAVEFVDDFMTSKPRHKVWFDKFGMESILLNKEDLHRINLLQEYDKICKRIANFESRMEHLNHTEKTLSFIRMIRDINDMGDYTTNIRFNPTRADYESLTQEIRDTIERTLNDLQ